MLSADTPVFVFTGRAVIWAELMNRGLCMTFTLHSGGEETFQASLFNTLRRVLHITPSLGDARDCFSMFPLFSTSFYFSLPLAFLLQLIPLRLPKRRRRGERNRMRREITNDDLPRHGTAQVAISATRSISLMN